MTWLIEYAWIYFVVALCTSVSYLGSALLLYGRLPDLQASVLVTSATFAGFLLGIWLQLG